MARLLMVDNEQDITDLVAVYLRRAQHDVLAAGSAQAALDLTDRHGRPDAVILDVDMPGMNGFELLDELRLRYPDLPALFLTVLWGGDIRTRAQAAGAAFVAKPCTPDDLRDEVQRLLIGGGPDTSRSDP